MSVDLLLDSVALLGTLLERAAHPLGPPSQVITYMHDVIVLFVLPFSFVPYIFFAHPFKVHSWLTFRFKLLNLLVSTIPVVHDPVKYRLDLLFGFGKGTLMIMSMAYSVSDSCLCVISCMGSLYSSFMPVANDSIIYSRLFKASETLGVYKLSGVCDLRRQSV